MAYARIQGKTALITHFQNSSLMNEDKRCRPILFHSEGSDAADQVTCLFQILNRRGMHKINYLFALNLVQEPLSSSSLNIQMHRSNGSDSGESSGSPPKDDGAGEQS